MRSPLTKLLSIFFCSLALSSCGESNDEKVVNSYIDIIQPEEPNEVISSNQIVQFNYIQSSNKQVYKSPKVQTNTFSNSSGSFRLPLSNQQLNSNLTASIDVSDPDGINSVYIGFPNSPEAYILCESQCGTQFHKTITGINPLDFEQISGELRLELWIDDSQNNRVLVNNVNFIWQATFISGFNAIRSSRNIDFSWQGLSGYLRYNIYISSIAGVNHENYQTLAGGQAFLALKKPELAFEVQNDSKVFFSIVTGVDGSGESAFSEEMKVSALNGAVDLAPIAENDFFSVNEDTELVGNLVGNDTDLEDGAVIINPTPIVFPNNGVLTINQDGSFLYEPTIDFNGRDIFTYEVSDELGQTNTALAVISILATNDEPESSYNNFNLEGVIKKQFKANIKSQSNAILDIPAPGLLINDLDIDSENLILMTTPQVSPSKGVLALNEDGSFTYTANEGVQGSDSFTYQVTDGQGGIAQSNVIITINGGSFPPVAANDKYVTEQDQTLIVNNSSPHLFSIISNDFDNDLNDTLAISENLIRGPFHGTLNLSSDGTFSYFPRSGYYGVDSFIYEITDLQGNTAQAGVIITVNRKNTAPITTKDSYFIDEDLVLFVDANQGVLANDIDIDLDVLKINTSSLLSPAQGHLIMATDGSFEYTPNANYFGTDTFQYQVVDELGLISIETVTIEVKSINDLPIANDDRAQTFSNTPVNINVLANDSDVDNDTLTVIGADVIKGGVEITQENTLVYNPETDFEGEIEIVYTVSDNSGGEAQGKVLVSINNSNNAPIAFDDIFALTEDSLMVISVPGLLNNDTDADGDILSVNTTAFTNVSNGIVTLSTDGSFSYQPNENFFGSDSFEYEVIDGEGGTDIGKATLTISSVNDNPIATDDTTSTVEETTININVLTNDSDVENDPLFVLSAISSAGIVNINSDNTLTYTPNINFIGKDVIDYTISDGNGGEDSAKVFITVINLNDDPVANPDTAATSEDESLFIDVLNNDTDSDGDTLTIIAATASNSSVLAVVGSSLSYTPNLNFNGSDSINYSISDGNGGTASSTVNVTVFAVNDDPIATPDIQTVNEDSTVSISVLINDSDVDGDNLSITTATASSGAVSIVDGANLSYTPNLNFNGSDSINYSISDGNGGTASSTVNVTVLAVNDDPIAIADNQSTNEDTSVNINILSNDSDIDGDTLSVTIATATHGSVTIETDKTLNYTPSSNFNGSDTINYSISDGNGGSTSSTVSLIIVAVNDAPIINDITTNITENSANATSVTTITAVDVDIGDSHTYSITINSDGIFGIKSSTGEITIADNSNLNYELSASHTIKIQVTDSGSLSDTADVSISVKNVAENVTPTIDSSFGNSGTAASNSFTKMRYDQPNDMILDSFGRIVVIGKNDFSGNTTDIFITRFNTDGTLDRNFGYQGVVNKDLGFVEEAVAVDIDSLGNIVVTGIQDNSTTKEVFVIRYTSVGVLDTNFNSIGYRITSYGYDTTAADVKVDASDNILVASNIGSGGGGFRVIKFANDGNSYTNADAIFTTGPDIPTSLLLQSDGKAVITGYANNSSTKNDFAVARFDVSTTPTLDSSYGSNGTSTFDFGSSTDDFSYDSYINSSNEVIMVGSSKPLQATDFAALKVSSTGTLDITSFASATNGLLIVDIDGDAGSGENTSIGRGVVEDQFGSIFFGIDKGTSNIESILYKTDSSGTIDSTYASSGQVIFDDEFRDNPIASIAIDTSDKLVLLTEAISARNNAPDLLLARFTALGALDTSFNSCGFNVFDPTFSNDSLNQVIELTVAPHVGKFVAVGSSEINQHLIVSRYNSDGFLDESFGSNGYYIKKDAENSFMGKDIIELSDGRLVVVGGTGRSGFITMLSVAGVLDTTFNSTGELTISSGGQLTLNAIDLESNKIVVGGTYNPSSGTKDMYLTKMDFTGILDNTFGTNGVAIFDLTTNLAEEETIEDIAVLSDGSIITIGVKHYVEANPEGLVAKVTSSGVLDKNGFAVSNGYLTVDLDPTASFNQDMLKTVKVKSNGKIVASGASSDSQTEVVVIQLNSNGSFDTSFDSDGIVSYNYGSGNAASLALALDASENILITGYNSNGTDEDIFIAKILDTGVKDILFNGSTGGILFDYGSNERASAILVRPDGTLIIAGGDNLNLFPTNFFYLQKINLVEP
ncbi:tandem-95 repeat protein [Pseudoalteromonas sp. NBT06-2]|uniref:tandem-95 repeat protein n=1 Tax=Pseudoalteromonas sp. NBT06-2 TaxID=2025950 RepID=UPI001483B8FC|nr:tandem-95 repeat protein [Pseudoalteromonas sp. NBT06-2]